MQINGDFSGLNPTTAPHVAPGPKRPIDAPVRNGQKADEDARQKQENEAAKDGRPVFNPTFGDAAPAGFQTDSNTETGTFSEAEATTPEFIRAEKRPTSEPVSLSGDDTNGLFANLAAARQAVDNAATRANPRQIYESAAGEYAKQSVSSSNVFAGRGDLLEIQA